MNKNARNQTFTLLKAQASGFFGLYRLFGKSRRFRGLRVAGTVTALTLLGLLMCGVSLSYSFSFAMMLESAGHLSLLPGLMMTLASLMILFTTLYKSSGILFSSGDTDMLLALPVKTSSIVTARILLLYAMDLLFSLVIMVPAGAVYALMASPGPLYWVFFTVMIFLIPLLPLVVASLLGTLVAAIASRFRHGAAIRSLMTILVLLVLCFSVGAAAPNGSVESLDEIGAMLSRMVYSLYPPAFWFVGALAEANVLSFALFCTVSVAAFLVFARLVGWRFQAISNALSSSRARSKYRLTALKTSSPRKALLKKEFKRLFSSPLYLMNTCIGLIMLIIFSVVILFTGPSSLQSIINIPGFSQVIYGALPLLPAFFISISSTSSCSISLEGKNFWIVRTAPVRAGDLFWSKIGVNLILNLSATLISGTLFVIAVRPDVTGGILMFAVPAAYSLFISVLGLFLNLMMPRFHWSSEAAVVKRGLAVTLTVLIGMVTSIVPLFAIFLTNGVYQIPLLLACGGVVLLLTAVMLIYLNQCGERRLLALGEAD